MNFIEPLWIINLIIITGYALQDFDIMPNDSEVDPGMTATLTCRVRNRRGECVWLKDGEVVGRISNKYIFEKQPSDGDCSIRITNANLEMDDGHWQCQVTQISLDDPVLKSKKIKLTVRETPQPPQIEDNTIQIKSGGNFKTRAGQPKKLSCVSRKGNPPAELKWFIEENDITAMASQTNGSDIEKPKTWQAISILHYTFLKIHSGKLLRCVALHKGYDTNSRETSTRLDVLYPPEIRLEGSPKEETEEGTSVTLKCVADANPKASIIWKMLGQANVYSIKEELIFTSVRRSDSGIYSCRAKNDIGESKELEISLDVKYKPEIRKVEPSPQVSLSLYSSAKLICQAVGNPQPEYSWLQKVPGEQLAWQERGNDPFLTIPNVTYSFQGRYICEAKNYIKGKEYKTQSEEIKLDVSGNPQVITKMTTTKDNVVVEKNEDVTVSVVFCSDPKPDRVFWEWGSLKLDAGSDLGRYIAEGFVAVKDWDDCYEARLLIHNVESSDSRKYTIHIENFKGEEIYTVNLVVREPLSMSMVIGITVGCIVLLVAILTILLCFLKKRKSVFKRKDGFNSDTESEMDSRRSVDVAHNGLAGNAPGAIPPDALYSAPKKQPNKKVENRGEGKHYENFKMDKNDNRDRDHLVYADLSFCAPSERNGHSWNRNGRSVVERTEYAEIQFPSKAKQRGTD
ncbi:irregular chiasm C-roughest protein-like isoform X1 [Tachypleus tridentatus]|uniref:irregular chiasm C-roughest protein-like isoform X1 n=1 Tax=Tachypleus tridentatus TaxID=6853 RepID=UPI003FD5B9A1